MPPIIDIEPAVIGLSNDLTPCATRRKRSSEILFVYQRQRIRGGASLRRQRPG